MKNGTKLALLMSGALALLSHSLVARFEEGPGKNYKEVKSVAQFKQLKNASRPTIVVFVTDPEVCSVCDMMEPAFNEIVGKYRGKADFYFLRTDKPELKGVGKQEGIEFHPTTFVYKKNGEKPVKFDRWTNKEHYDNMVYKWINGTEKPARRSTAPVPTSMTKKAKA